MTVELIWGAPDIKAIQAHPFTTRMMLEGRSIKPSEFRKAMQEKMSRRQAMTQSRPVMYLDERFESIRAAAEAYGCTATKIHADIKRGRGGCGYL